MPVPPPGGPYVAGSSIRVSVLFVDPTNRPADPNTVQLKYRRPNDTATTTVTYPAPPIVRDGVGAYHADFDTTGQAPAVLPGNMWQYQWMSAPGDPVLQAISGPATIGAGLFSVIPAGLS